jgi:hypothetical protein
MATRVIGDGHVASERFVPSRVPHRNACGLAFRRETELGESGLHALQGLSEKTTSLGTHDGEALADGGVRLGRGDGLDLVREFDRERGLEIAPGHLLHRRGRGGERGVVGFLGLRRAAEALAEEKLDGGDAGADVAGR